MAALLASLPLALILLLMLAARWRALYAGLVGVGVALILAYWSFGFGTSRLPDAGPAGAFAGALLEALFNALTILWIIFPALAIYELQTRSGAIEHIRNVLVRLSADRRTQALFIAFFFGMFLEGAAGFGTPIALGAPLLVGIGFSPLRAVVLVLIGHAAGVSFGAVGTPVLAQSAINGLPASEIARETGLLHAVLGPILLAFMYRFAGESPPTLMQWGRAALAALCFFCPFAILAIFVGPELPTLGGALIGAIGFAALVRERGRQVETAGFVRTLKAGIPYAIILILILVTRLIPAAREGLRALEISWSLEPSFAGSMQPLYHPGTMLLVGFVLGGLLQGRSFREIIACASAAARRLFPVAAALFAMLLLSRVMVHAGMIHALAEAAAGTGWAWAMLAPLVGVLGTFVTGSATASNILFTEFQTSTARVLGLPLSTMSAAQGFGAAVGNAICPHNVIAGFATVRLVGNEGAAIARTAPACLIYSVAGGILLALVVS